MNENEILAYIQAGQVLLVAGGATIHAIKAMFGAHPAMTEDDLNRILDGIAADAQRRLDIARADAGEAPPGTNG